MFLLQTFILPVQSNSSASTQKMSFVFNSTRFSNLRLKQFQVLNKSCWNWAWESSRLRSSLLWIDTSIMKSNVDLFLCFDFLKRIIFRFVLRLSGILGKILMRDPLERILFDILHFFLTCYFIPFVMELFFD